MEEILNEKRATASRKYALAAERAAEKAAKHPQLGDSNEIIPTDPTGMPHGGSKDNISGLQRVIGRGRRRVAAAPAAPPPSPDQDPHGMGKALARHLRKLHGGAFMKGFATGMSSTRSRSSSPEEAPCRGKGRPMESGKRIPDPAGLEVTHAKPGRRPPNAVPAQAYGSPPQAPASFAKNSVGMGMPDPSVKAARRRRAEPMNSAPTTTAPVEGSGRSDKRRSRGAMISKLMKEHGMSLGEASRYLKTHGTA